MKSLFLIFFLFFFFLNLRSQTIAPEDAKNYVGKRVTVCGKVKSTYKPDKINARPTFVDFGGKYPNNVFSVVIWENDLPKFNYVPKRKLKRKNICVTGEIKLYKNKPEIVVTDPSQIEFRKK
jgi:hypothetical protein